MYLDVSFALFFQSPSSKTLVIDKDATGYTPVHYAARAGYLQVQRKIDLSALKILATVMSIVIRSKNVDKKLNTYRIYPSGHVLRDNLMCNSWVTGEPF